MHTVKQLEIYVSLTKALKISEKTSRVSAVKDVISGIISVRDAYHNITRRNQGAYRLMNEAIETLKSILSGSIYGVNNWENDIFYHGSVKKAVMSLTVALGDMRQVVEEREAYEQQRLRSIDALRSMRLRVVSGNEPEFMFAKTN